MTALAEQDADERTGALSAQTAAAWAIAIPGIELSGAEAEWFGAEMSRGAAAIERAAAGRPLSEVRMAAFDQMLLSGVALR